MLHHSQEINLYEAAFTRYGTALGSALLDPGDRPVRRLEFLTACLRSVKAFFDVFLRYPLPRYSSRC